MRYKGGVGARLVPDSALRLTGTIMPLNTGD